jgi:sugar/nucleoside kinase (ribokinase family)
MDHLIQTFSSFFYGQPNNNPQNNYNIPNNNDKITISIVGDLFLDVVVTGVEQLPTIWGQDFPCNSISLHAGGGASNTAVHLSSLEHSLSSSAVSSMEGNKSNSPSLEVRFYAGVGKCCLERTVIEEHLRKNHVEFIPCVFPQDTIGMVVVLSGKTDRSFISNPGATGLLSVKHLDIPKIVIESNHLAVGGLFNLHNLIQPNGEGLIELFEQVVEKSGEKKLTISLDCNSDMTGKWGQPWIYKALSFVHVFKTNETEARGITGNPTGDLTEIALILASKVKTCAIITIGVKGCLLAKSNSRSVIHVPAPKLDQVIDTTGAGDAFMAGFLVKWLKGDDLETSCKFAVRCGTTKCKNIGACTVPLVKEYLVE